MKPNPRTAFQQIPGNYGTLINWLALFFFLSTSEIGKQVIWRISLDFGSLRIKFSYLVSQKAERALFTSDFLWRSVCLFGSNAHVWKVHNKMKVLVNGLVF